tara:strand:+ start:243 stop:689 length:447 start_codon:yes stop_codon:yes gene_type:complete
MLEDLCTPALMYMAFSMVQIIIDVFSGIYNIAFFKFITMVIFTSLLQILCVRGLGVISWVIVFIPFVLMTFVSMMLMSAFGFSDNTILDTTDAQLDNTNKERLQQDKQVIEEPQHYSIPSKKSAHFSDTNEKLKEINTERLDQDARFS